MPIDYRISALLGEDFARKNTPFAVGTPVRIEYAMPTARPTDWPETGFEPLGSAAARRELVQQALALIEATCGIDFVEADASTARIVFGVSPIPEVSTAGYAQTFYRAAADGYEGYVSYVVYDDELTSAANVKQAIVHEIGHALGLKHPGAYAPADEGPFLPAAEDSTRYTVMSYHIEVEDALALGPYDIEALRYLYGEPIAPGERVGVTLSGQVRRGSAADELFALDSYDWWSHHDATTTFHASGGIYRASADGLTIDGAAGIDEVRVSLPRQEVTLDRNAAGEIILTSTWRVELVGGQTGELLLTDRLVGIERLHFTDGILAFDTLPSEPAATAYALLHAALAAPPPAALLGQWIARCDAGLSASQVASEIIAHYAPDIEAVTLVELLYRNLVGTSPSAQELAALTEMIDSGAYSRGDFYAAAAQHELNLAQIAGIQQTGVFYV